MPGKRGSRRYTTKQFEAFQQISRALADGKLVSVSSREDIGRAGGAVGHSAGETKVKGLAAKHAYSVVSCRTDDHRQRVREIADGGGNFELELSDLTKRFHTIRATT